MVSHLEFYKARKQISLEKICLLGSKFFEERGKGLNFYLPNFILRYNTKLKSEYIKRVGLVYSWIGFNNECICLEGTGCTETKSYN